jgi:hypothetical protein
MEDESRKMKVEKEEKQKHSRKGGNDGGTGEDGEGARDGGRGGPQGAAKKGTKRDRGRGGAKALGKVRRGGDVAELERSKEPLGEVVVERFAVARVDGVGDTRRSHQREQRPVDVAWLTWVDRFKFVTVELAARAFGVAVPNARRRLNRLVDEGWLAKATGFGSGEQRLYWIAPAGSSLLGNTPRKTAGLPRDYRHEMAVIARVIRLEASAGEGQRVLTERECRRAEAREEGEYSVKDGKGRAGRRWPDIVARRRDGRLVGFEVELTQKEASRYRGLVTAYTQSQYARVFYETPVPGVVRRVNDLSTTIRGSTLRSVRNEAVRKRMDARLCVVEAVLVDGR